MNLFSKTLFVSAAAVLTLAPMSASALPPDCDVQCEGTPPCWLVCAVPWGMRVITCEQWINDYALGGTCTPDAQDPYEEEELSSVEPRQGDMPGMASACHSTPELTSAR
ncbi:hypothetical protein [Corallococcus macrosporus]|uniref:Lipoprotein n=1 Tax=Corallococcus macrosporus DSM 14697 TaxID=1189310 RepID=A0A250K4X3_9BACT|nr:hypothetical protein [Corallococcus macrosporus]ATB51038.1 hypothetical protein MYMAC_006695 [Corallococcus macrosporus DSM 14697]